MVVEIKNQKVDLKEISRLYPAAIIEYADGTVTQISLEWLDESANEDVTLLYYALCLHYREEETSPLLFSYQNREDLEKEISSLASQLKGSS